MERETLSAAIKKEAIRIGFDGCGISKAEKLSNHETFLKNWLDKGLHATMDYMNNYFEKRIDPSVLMPGAKSVISVLLNYYPAEIQKNENAPIVAKYAYGNDYHFVLKRKLNLLLTYIQENLSPCQGRVFTDSAPLLERALAAKAGIGWIGKNTLLIAPKIGSFIFLGEILIDIELEYDSPIEERCGSCTKCLHACPTNALVAPYILDSNRCISYHTIENRAEIPDKYRGKFLGRVFGCDICQDVCPWNKDVILTSEQEFFPTNEFLEMTQEDWYQIDVEKYQKVFKKSAVKRAKFNGLKRNINFIRKIT